MKIRKICPECGSANVVFDARAYWDEERQEYVFRGIDSDTLPICEDCGEEITPKDEEILS
jgi:predicted RNA-binding Zn-ribbon protein involved in translation (DUF1610 family)